MIKKLLLLIPICGVSFYNWAQTFTVFENDFESASSFSAGYTGGDNQWIKNTCAGNGITKPGSYSLYISPSNGVTNDCAPVTGKFRYEYVNSISPTGGALAYTDIDATCTGSLQITFDYKHEGVLGEESLELVYSTDGGVTYNPISPILAQTSSWSAQSFSIPAIVDGTIFKIGFRYIYNDANINGIAPAVDNIKVTGVDNIAPIINTCVPNINYSLNVNCEVTVMDEKGAVVATDNCTAMNDLILSQSPAPGAVTFTQPGQTQIFTITVLDAAGNSAQCTFTGTAIDNNNPTVTCPTLASVALNASCEATIPDLTGLAVWADNCTVDPNDMIFSQNPMAGTIVNDTTDILFIVTDPYNNSTQCISQFMVYDNIAPTLTCPTNDTIYKNTTCDASIGDYTSQVVINENCTSLGYTLTQSPVIGTPISVPTVVTMNIVDLYNNTGNCNFTVVPLDTTSASIICPNDSTVSSALCTYSMTDYGDDAVITDNCSAIFNINITQTPTISTVLNAGVHLVTIQAEDESNNISTCTFNLTVEDLIAPTINCPANQNLIVDANCSATLADYTSSATGLSDNCTVLSNLTVTQSPVAGTTINANTQIILTVEDENNNQTSCNFFAIVVDTIKPSVTCIDTMQVAINSSCQYTVTDLTSSLTISDNCTSLGNMGITQNPPNGSVEYGLTSVLFTVMDDQGNQSTCSTILQAIDTEAPQITCPNPSPINNGTNCNYTLTNYGGSTLVLDNCSDYSLTQNPPAGTSLVAGDQTITMTVIDAGGNTESCSFTLTIIETQDPTISCPTNITTCNPVVSYSAPVYADNCISTLSQTDLSGLTSGDTFPVGFTIQEYTVTDASGNTETCAFSVQVLDYPAAAIILNDTTLVCGATSTVVDAQAHTTGTGSWSIVTGTGNFNNVNASSTGVNNLSFGETVIAYTISTASCGSTSDTALIITTEQPSIASTQDTIYACFDNSVPLLSNPPLVGTGIWTTNDPTANISDVSSANTNAINLTFGWHDYIWTISNGFCPSSSDTLRVYVTPTANVAQNDTAVCLETVGSLTISGNMPASGQTIEWKVVSGDAVLSATNTTTISISNLSLGVNNIVYKLYDDECGLSTDTLNIVASLCEGINPDFPTVITPNLDGKNDVFVINNLQVIYPDCEVIIFNRWGSIVYESIGYQIPWDGTFKGENLPMGTYFYNVKLNDQDNTVYKGPISIIR